MNRLVQIIYATTLVVLSLIAASILYLVNSKYATIYNLAVNSIPNKDAIKLLPNYLTAEKWHGFKLLLCLALGIILLIFYILTKYRNKVKKIVQIFLIDVKNLFSVAEFNKPNKLAFYSTLLFLVMHSLYYIHSWALTHDELWTYNYFVNTPIWNSFLLPNNNHYFYTSIVWWFNLLFAAKWALRLVALLGMCAGWCVFVKTVYKYLPTYLFIPSIVLLACSMPVLYYAVIGRAYSFTLLFAGIQLYTLLAIKNKEYNNKFIIYFALATILGLFSNICFLYAAIANNIILIGIKYKKFFKAFIIQSIGTLLLLSTPLLILKGATPIQKIATVKASFSFIYLLKGASTLEYYYLGIVNTGHIFLAILCLCTIWFIYRPRFIATICLVQLWVVLCAFSIQQTTLYERLFTYTEIFVVPLIVLLLAIIFNKIQRQIFIVALLYGVAAVFTFTKHPLFTWSIAIDKAADKVAKQLYKANIDTCYTANFYVAPAIDFYFKQKQKNIYQYKAEQQSISYKPLDSLVKYKAIINTVESKTIYPAYIPKQVDSIYIIWY
jgi:hypothetical protein